MKFSKKLIPAEVFPIVVIVSGAISFGLYSCYAHLRYNPTLTNEARKQGMMYQGSEVRERALQTIDRRRGLAAADPKDLSVFGGYERSKGPSVNKEHETSGHIIQ